MQMLSAVVKHLLIFLVLGTESTYFHTVDKADAFRRPRHQTVHSLPLFVCLPPDAVGVPL